MRSDLKAAIKPLRKELIEEILGMEVVDLLSDSTLETQRVEIIAVLGKNPKFRPSSSSSKQPIHPT